MAQDVAKMARDGAKIAQEGTKISRDGAKVAQGPAKMAPRWPKKVTRWPQDGPRMTPRWLQDGPGRAKQIVKYERFLSCHFLWPKTAQDGAKITHDGAETAQEGTKMAPKRLQDNPRWPRDGPRMALDFDFDFASIRPRRESRSANNPAALRGTRSCRSRAGSNSRNSQKFSSGGLIPPRPTAPRAPFAS